MTNEEALAVLRESNNNKLLFDDGGKIAWIANDPKNKAKYVALFYPSDREPIVESNALWSSRPITTKAGERSTNAKVNIAGAKKLYLVVTDGGDGINWDHADWIKPTLTGKRGSVKLTDLRWISASSGWGAATIDKSVGGNALNVDNKEYAGGIGTHANSVIEYDIPDGYDTLAFLAGLDKECVDHTEGATVRFLVFTRYPAGSPPADSITMSLRIDQLGMKGPCNVRDLWAKKDIGEYTIEIPLCVRKHGARLLKISEVF